MKRVLGFLFVLTTALTTAAIAAPTGHRVRGSIQSSNGASLIVHSRHGKNVRVMLNSSTKYVYVVKSSLSKVDKGSYIGTATKKKGNSLVALEVVVFPKSMRGAGEGHYAWDKLPDATKRNGGNTVSSKMTNGNVAHASKSGAKSRVKSMMTNGNIKMAHSQSGAKEITVTYKGGQKHITVPPAAPIVSFQKASKGALKQGAKVFIIASGKKNHLTAKMVAIGKDGLKPPM